MRQLQPDELNEGYETDEEIFPFGEWGDSNLDGEDLALMGIADPDTLSINPQGPSREYHAPRPPVLPPDAILLVAEQLATEQGYTLDELTTAAHVRGRPDAERKAKLDALGEIVQHLRKTEAGIGSKLRIANKREPVATLEAIGKALGLEKKAVQRLEQRPINDTNRI